MFVCMFFMHFDTVQANATKGRGTFWAVIGPYRKIGPIRLKLSAIIECVVLWRSYKFQHDPLSLRAVLTFTMYALFRVIRSIFGSVFFNTLGHIKGNIQRSFIYHSIENLILNKTVLRSFSQSEKMVENF